MSSMFNENVRGPRSRRVRFAVAAAAATGAVGLVAALPAPAAEAAATATASTTATFGYTGSVQTVTVPVGVYYAQVTAVGGGGGDDTGANGGGGLGALVSGYRSVTPGSTVSVVVGGAGSNASQDTGGFEIHHCVPAAGGWSKLGASNYSGGTSIWSGGSCSASGGGASLVQIDGVVPAVAAGGGGGADYPGGIAGLDSSPQSLPHADGGPHGGDFAAMPSTFGGWGTAWGSQAPGAGGGGGVRGGTDGPPAGYYAGEGAGGGGAGSSIANMDRGYIRPTPDGAGSPGTAGQVTINWLPNLAAGRPVTASTSVESAPTWQRTNLTDGQLTSIATDKGYTSNISTGPEWVAVDLGVSQRIDTFRLYPRTAVPGEPADMTGAGFPSRLVMYTSNDGVKWTDAGLYAVWDGQSADAGRPVTYRAADGTPGSNPTPAAGRYVKIVAEGLGRAASDDSGQRLQLAELQVFPPAA
jgi:hypothetical protein